MSPAATVRGSANTIGHKGGYWASGITTVTVGVPTITGFTPSSGNVGDAVTITGTNYDGTVTVKFNGTVATISSQTSTQLVVTVPSGGSTGKINVANSAGNVDSATNFTVNAGVGVAPSYAPDNTWMGVAGETGFGADRKDMWQDMLTQGLNLKIVRLGFNWGTVEPTQGNWSWGGTDTQVLAALGMGLQVLLNTNYAAGCWTGAQFDVPGNISWVTFKAKYKIMIQNMVNRYHKNGNAKVAGITSTNYVKYYEIWNEQNNDGFWNSTDNANGFGMGQPDPYYYAELLGVAYDAIKEICGADAIVMWGGFAVAPLSSRTDPDGNKWEPNWMGLLLSWWGSNYTKHPDGWAKIPSDAIVMHPYDSGRNGANQFPTNAIPPKGITDCTGNFTTSVTGAKIPQVWNKCAAKGFGSMKIWATEAGGSWRENAVDGQGVRYGGSPAQTADEWKIMSPQEAYNHERTAFRVWRGLDNWPTGSNLTKFSDTTTLSNPAFTAASVAHLGPRFYFGLRDHKATPYSVPYTVDENYGLYKKLAGASGNWAGASDTWALKRKTGGGNDVFEALALF